MAGDEALVNMYFTPDFSCGFYRRIFAKEREFYSENEAFVSVMFLHNGALKKDKDLAEKPAWRIQWGRWDCISKEMIDGIFCHLEVLKLKRGDCLVNNITRLFFRVEEHRTRHQNGMGKRVT